MRVERLPGRGETLLGTGYRVDYGGKGSNQAVGCARLGARVSFVARIGDDSFGQMALALYREEGIDVAHVKSTNGVPTGVGFIVVDAAGNNCIVLDPGANDHLTEKDVAGSAPAFDGVSVVLTQLEIPVAAAAAAMARGRQAGAMTILNPAPVRPLPASILELVDILTPNESEAYVLAGRDPGRTVEPQQVARELIDKGVKQVVMTLGEHGVLIVSAQKTTHVGAIAVSAVDTVGAGDAFNAGLAVALSWGAPLEPAVRFATVTGGLAVTKEGVIPALPRREEVIGYCRQSGTAPPDWIAGGRGSI
jgi:ribokinase